MEHVQTLSPWALKLKAHLEEFSPNLVLELWAEGKLNEYVQSQADHAAQIVADHLETGLPFNQAFEFVKDQLYPPPEQPAPQ